MFFIHGGAYNDGSGESYDARSLVNASVALRSPTIVITINYRLSFFGFSGIYLLSLAQDNFMFNNFTFAKQTDSRNNRHR
jgi:carboxylesterase type B